MKVVIIGGGPAGMLSAISAGTNKNDVTILEKMNMLGRKLLITGKGRCNITSSIPIDEFIKNVPGNGKFLYSCLNNFTNEDILNILKEEGLQTKVERGNRVFPITDKSQDVLQALLNRLKKLKVKNIDKTFEYMDKELIQYIDAIDNMQLEHLENKTLPDFIKLCNPKWNEKITENEAFINALKLADEFWRIYIKHAIAEVEAIEIILESINKCKECYLIFDAEMPYRKAIKYINNNKVKYIIFKSRREGYDIRTLVDSCKFKDDISQEPDINVAKKITGIDDLIYADVNGKLCCTKTLESAIKIVKYNEKMMEEMLYDNN